MIKITKTKLISGLILAFTSTPFLAYSALPGSFGAKACYVLLMSDLTSEQKAQIEDLKQSAQLAFDNNDLEDAARFQKEILKIDDDNIEALRKLIRIYSKLKTEDKVQKYTQRAIRVIVATIETQSSNAHLHDLLAGFYVKTQQYNLATITAMKSIELGGPTRYNILALAEVALSEQDQKSALSILDVGLEKLPKDSYLMNKKNYILMGLGRFAEALPIVDARLKQQSSHIPTIIARARILSELGRSAEAIEFLNRKIKWLKNSDLEKIRDQIQSAQ
jgi:tetratricopeptide (TPR) repeat protein